MNLQEIIPHPDRRILDSKNDANKKGKEKIRIGNKKEKKEIPLVLNATHTFREYVDRYE